MENLMKGPKGNVASIKWLGYVYKIRFCLHKVSQTNAKKVKAVTTWTVTTQRSKISPISLKFPINNLADLLPVQQQDHEPSRFVALSSPSHTDNMASVLDQLPHKEATLYYLRSMLNKRKRRLAMHLYITGAARSFWFPLSPVVAVVKPTGNWAPTQKSRGDSTFSSWTENAHSFPSLYHT